MLEMPAAPSVESHAFIPVGTNFPGPAYRNVLSGCPGLFPSVVSVVTGFAAYFVEIVVANLRTADAYCVALDCSLGGAAPKSSSAFSKVERRE